VLLRRSHWKSWIPKFVGVEILEATEVYWCPIAGAGSGAAPAVEAHVDLDRRPTLALRGRANFAADRVPHCK
jgi:hypothetical protein